MLCVIWDSKMCSCYIIYPIWHDDEVDKTLLHVASIYMFRKQARVNCYVLPMVHIIKDDFPSQEKLF